MGEILLATEKSMLDSPQTPLSPTSPSLIDGGSKCSHPKRFQVYSRNSHNNVVEKQSIKSVAENVKKTHLTSGRETQPLSNRDSQENKKRTFAVPTCATVNLVNPNLSRGKI